MPRRRSPRAAHRRPSPLLVAALAVAALQSCGGEPDCAPFDDADVPGRGVNPDGVDYPAQGWGARPRQGDVPGDTFPNFSFRGYVDSDRAAGLQTVSLADYYDPEAKRHKVLCLSLVVMWCPHCNRETAQLAARSPTLRQEGAEFLQAVAEGPEGSAPTLCDLGDWTAEHGTSFTVVLDARARRIGSVSAVTGVPWNVLVDTRTMEVLAVDIEELVDVDAYVRAGIEWVESHPR
ncbi:MAG: redoxin domain-containing protein [Deltaproteobacteria bacterium]|nr:redoxin domain-containing protein [Deltaproteobacteria bacterium]